MSYDIKNIKNMEKVVIYEKPNENVRNITVYENIYCFRERKGKHFEERWF